MDNYTVGQNIAKLRKLKDIKAYEMAKNLQMRESTYTKYERGETAITIDFINKVANVLGIEPLHILTASPSTIFQAVANSSGENGTTLSSVKENAKMLQMIECVITLNQRLTQILENM